MTAADPDLVTDPDPAADPDTTPRARPSRLTSTGTGAGGITLLLAVVLGLISLRGSNPWLLLLACSLLTPVILSPLLRPDLGSISVCFRSEDRVAVGSSAEQVFHVHNRGRRSSPALQLAHTVRGFAPATMSVPALPPGGRAELAVLRPALTRGLSLEHEIRLWTAAPFGLARHQSRHQLTARISVHPAPGPVAQLPGVAQGAGGGRPNRAGDEPHELREWRRGDSLRHVHWRATARYDRLTVVIPENTVRSRLALVVEGVDDDVEAMVSTAAWTAVQAARSDGIVRLSAAGRPEYVGDDPAAVLDWFAALGTRIGTDPQLLPAAAAWAGHTGSVLLAGTRAPEAGPDRNRYLVLSPDGQVTGL